MKKGAIIISLLLIFNLFLISAANNSQNSTQEVYDINVIKTEGELSYLHIKDIVRTKTGFNISYEFDNTNFIGEDIQVDIWVSYLNGSEITRTSDIFKLNRDNPIKRKTFLLFPKDYSGEYYISFSIYPDKEVMKESIFVDKLPEEKKTNFLTGNTIFENSGYKMWTYGFFILIILVFIFMIARKHDKNIEKTQADISDESTKPKDKNKKKN